MTLPIRAPIRRLGLADLEACLALSADRGWPPEGHKWMLLLDAAEGFGIDDPDGGLAGSVVLARYGTELASVRNDAGAPRAMAARVSAGIDGP